MKHSRHLQKIAQGQMLVLWREKNPGQTKTETGRALNISPRRFPALLEYYEKHKHEPAIPELAELRHADVCQLGLASVTMIREMLVRNFSASNGLSKPEVKCSKTLVRQLAAAVGLVSFSYRGRQLIHWKHDPQSSPPSTPSPSTVP